MDEATLKRAIEDAAQVADKVRTIGLPQVRELAEAVGSVGEVERAALALEVVPIRYLRNLGTVGIDGQLRLLQAKVAIVGLGGLGGYVAEALARMGVGCLVLIDGDNFDEHNLNRQLLSTENNLKASKAEVASRHISEINAGVKTVCHSEVLTGENVGRLLSGAHVVVDALDSLPMRLVLQDGAQELGIPMVHGSIGGLLGQVMTVFPDDPGLHALYGSGEGLPEQGLEAELGTPSATPMAVAAWEAQEVVKLVTGLGEPLRGRLLMMDMESGTAQILQLA